MTRVPPHMRCGSKERARHRHNREIIEQYIRDSEFEPDLLTDTEYPKQELELEYKQMLLEKVK